MTFGLRLVVIGLASLGAANVVASLAAWILAPHAARWRHGSARRRAAKLSWLRLLPSTAGWIAATLVLVAFVAFEPRDRHEVVGRSLPILAALAGAILTTAAWRAIAILRATRRIVRTWMLDASPVSCGSATTPAFAVSTAFPIVAVVGLFRPRLVIARSVLDACTPEELQAVLAHEQGHADRRDNLRRLLLSCAPDVLAWLPAASRLVNEWHEAIEDAADDDAERAGADGRLRLAEALLKVARLAPTSVLEARLPASALYRGECLDRRVRRLLDARQESETPRSPWPARVAVLAAIVVASAGLPVIHELVEAAVRLLP